MLNFKGINIIINSKGEVEDIYVMTDNEIFSLKEKKELKRNKKVNDNLYNQILSYSDLILKKILSKKS